MANYKMTGPVTVAYHSRPTPQGTMTEDFLDAGKNPPDGVIVHYFLPEKPEGDAALPRREGERTPLVHQRREGYQGAGGGGP
ncbi:MAG: hypothetical protein U0841_13820 [Chloroflexia bacterium]